MAVRTIAQIEEQPPLTFEELATKWGTAKSDAERFDVARSLWVYHRNREIPQTVIVQRVGRSAKAVNTWIGVWEYCRRHPEARTKTFRECMAIIRPPRAKP